MRLLIVLSAISLALPSHLLAADQVLGKTVRGTPEIGKIDVVAFAPGGALLVGDGTRQQILAVKLPEPSPAGEEAAAAEVKGIKARLAERMGTPRDGVEIVDLAVHPVSGRAFLAVRKQDDRSQHLVRVRGDGALELVSLADVEYVRVPIPAGDKAPVSLVTDVVWAGDRLVAAARCNEEFASKIFAAEGPLDHEKAGQLYAAETFHVAHNQWETKAPMNVMIPYQEKGKHYIIGAFSCTPVVKYAVDAIQPGARIKGESMIELGSGNRPLDMFAYVKDGEARILTNTFRFHHEKRPFGPSPHLAFRFDEALLGASGVNEGAVRRLDAKDPAAARIRIAESFHGVVQMDRRDDETALVLREAADGEWDLVALSLP